MDKKILQSLYLDPDLDLRLKSRAAAERLTKPEVIRRFLEEGLDRPAWRLAKAAEAKKSPVEPEAKPGDPQWCECRGAVTPACDVELCCGEHCSFCDKPYDADGMFWREDNEWRDDIE